MLGELIEQNLARDPSRIRLLAPATTVIEATDAGVAVSITTSPAGVTLVDGIEPRASVRIRAGADDLVRLVAAPLRFGLPDPLRGEGRSMIADVIRGKVRVRGLALHPLQVARLSTLLSVHQDPA